MVIYADPNNVRIQFQRLSTLSLVRRRNSSNVRVVQLTDRQMDGQTEQVHFTKLYGWETLAKIRNNHCREGQPIV